MTKASKSRVHRSKSRREIAASALNIAAHGRLIEVEVDGEKIKMWAMPSSAQQVVMMALETLAR